MAVNRNSSNAPNVAENGARLQPRQLNSWTSGQSARKTASVSSGSDQLAISLLSALITKGHRPPLLAGGCRLNTAASGVNTDTVRSERMSAACIRYVSDFSMMLDERALPAVASVKTVSAANPSSPNANADAC